MNKKNKRGFSLAELLISLLIISLVLSAAIPTITRRSAQSREQIWRWTNYNNDIYFGVGESQSAILGHSVMPQNVTYFYSDYDLPDEEGNYVGESINADTDKLAIIQTINEYDRTFEKSHISFYTAQKTSDATASDSISYAGRLAMDRTNIALGIGSLQALQNDNTGNTALGHYSLYHNNYGVNNTAVGYLSLGNLNGTTNNSNQNSNNTAVGYLSLGNLKNASSDTNQSNTAIGTGACSSIASGSNNICIGNYSGYDLYGGSYTVKPGSTYTDISNRLFIGSNTLNSNGDPEFTNADIITGYTYYSDGNYDKELDVNARYFKVKAYDASSEMFTFTADRGSTGYGTSNGDTYSGITDFNYYRDSKDNNYNATNITTGGDKSNIYIRTTFADSASGSYPYEGTIDINNSALTYVFSESSANNSYRVDMNTDQELSISSANSSVDVSAINNLSLTSTSSDSSSSAEVDINAGSNGDSISLSSSNGLAITTLNAMNLYSKKEINISSDTSINLYSKSGANMIVDSGAINIGNNTDNLIIDTSKASYSGTFYASDFCINTGYRTCLSQLSQQNQYSDIRLKDILGDSTAGLKEINALEVKNFTFKNDEEKAPHVGVIAQSLQKIFPNSVFEDKNTGYLKIKTEEIFYAMVNSIKELCAQIQDLTAKITGLDKRITELENENKQLKKQNEDFEKRLSKLEKKK